MKAKACLIVLFSSTVLFGCWFRVTHPPAKAVIDIGAKASSCVAYARRLKSFYKEDALEYTEAEGLYGTAKSAYDKWISLLEEGVRDHTKAADIQGYSETCQLAAENSAQFIEYVKAKTPGLAVRSGARTRGVGMPALGGEGEEAKLPGKEELAKAGIRWLEDIFKAKQKEIEQRKEQAIKELEKLRWPDFRKID